MPGSEDDDDSVISVVRIKSEAPPKRRAKKIKYPRRTPSLVVPEREIIYITPDKTCCKICSCYPPEDPYRKPKKLKPCQYSPRTLYELAGDVVDGLPQPEQFSWTVEDVANWMEEYVGLPQYKNCIVDNYINGRRLVMLEDPSVMPQINIHDFEHIMMITAAVRKTFTMEKIRFHRSINLLSRKPFTYITLFKSRTGPSWGMRQNSTNTDVLRWAHVLMPKPTYMNHWDLVWYLPPDFPKIMCARKSRTMREEFIPRYVPPEDICNEYLAPRKFRIQHNIPEEAQLIWMEHRVGSPQRKVPLSKKPVQAKQPETEAPKKQSRLIPQPVSLTGLKGKDLILARRKASKPKFLKTVNPQKMSKGAK